MCFFLDPNTSDDNRLSAWRSKHGKESGQALLNLLQFHVYLTSLQRAVLDSGTRLLLAVMHSSCHELIFNTMYLLWIPFQH